MKSWNFPNLFKGNAVDIAEDAIAAKQALELLLNSEIQEFVFDPVYGCNIPSLTFSVKSKLTEDLIVDSIYELQLYCPNLRFERNQVQVTFTEPGECSIYIPIRIDLNNFSTEVFLYAEAKD